MATLRPVLENGEKYHIVSRSVDNRSIFKETKDYQRFVRNLYWFNDNNITFQEYSRFYATDSACKEIMLRAKQDRILLVKIISVCIMSNHIHLLLEQVEDGGISQFIKKIAGGYACYFNNKYKRHGHLFQGRFKVKYIKTKEQLINTAIYIHTNAAVFVDNNWNIGKVTHKQKIIDYIEKYKWSSYRDYLGFSNLSSILDLETLRDIMPADEWKKRTNTWIATRADYLNNDDISFE